MLQERIAYLGKLQKVSYYIGYLNYLYLKNNIINLNILIYNKIIITELFLYNKNVNFNFLKYYYKIIPNKFTINYFVKFKVNYIFFITKL